MIRFLNIRAMALGALGVVALALVVGIGKNMYQGYVLHGQVIAAQDEAKQLQQNNDGIQQLMQSFQQANTVELEGRKDLNLQKPGEQAVVIIPPKNYPQDNAPAATKPMLQASPEVQQNNAFSGQIAHRAQLWWRFVFP